MSSNLEKTDETRHELTRPEMELRRLLNEPNPIRDGLSKFDPEDWSSVIAVLELDLAIARTALVLAHNRGREKPLPTYETAWRLIEHALERLYRG